MPNTREKLIELLDEVTEKLTELCGGLNDHNGNGVRADHLIANGVTVQGWISVTERLPEETIQVLTVDDEYWIEIDALSGDEWISARNVTHWMPLPEPPKEVPK